MDHLHELRLDVQFHDNDAIPLDALTTVVSALEHILREYEGVYLDGSTVDWHISTLGLASVDVGISPRSASPDLGDITGMTNQLIQDARALEAGGTPEELLPGNAARFWSQWMKLFQTSAVRTFALRAGGESAEMTQEGAGAYRLSPERRVLFETLRGTMTGVNFARANYFTLYRIEGGRALKCYFPDELQNDVIAALRQRVDVSGRVKTTAGDEVQSVKITSPPRILRAESAIPRVRDLVGIDPGLTEGQDAVDWVRRQHIGD